MTSIVFFGLDGRYSTILLEALVHAELAPGLVVIGREEPVRRARRDGALRRAQVPWWRRALRPKVAAVSDALDPIDLAARALALGIDVLEVSDPGASAACARIAERAPSCFVVAGFHRLLPRRVLELSQKGGVNVHPGRLPEERGPAPLFWMLKAGRIDGAVTIHMLDAGEDTGDIVGSVPFQIRPGMTGRETLERAAQAAAPLLVRSVRALLGGDLVRTHQPRDGAGRCPRPKMSDCRVDPGLSAERVFTYVAGCAGSYPVFVECGGDRFFIENAVSFDDAAPMSCEYLLSGDRLLLRCSPGVVELELKPGGALFTAEYEEETEPSPQHLRG